MSNETKKVVKKNYPCRRGCIGAVGESRVFHREEDSKRSFIAMPAYNTVIGKKVNPKPELQNVK